MRKLDAFFFGLNVLVCFVTALYGAYTFSNQAANPINSNFALVCAVIFLLTVVYGRVTSRFERGPIQVSVVNFVFKKSTRVVGFLLGLALIFNLILIQTGKDSPRGNEAVFGRFFMFFIFVVSYNLAIVAALGNHTLRGLLPPKK